MRISVGINGGDEVKGGDVEGVKRRQALMGGTTWNRAPPLQHNYTSTTYMYFNPTISYNPPETVHHPILPNQYFNYTLLLPNFSVPAETGHPPWRGV